MGFKKDFKRVGVWAKRVGINCGDICKWVDRKEDTLKTGRYNKAGTGLVVVTGNVI